MASKKGGKCKRSYFRAKIATNVGTCVFCQRAVDDEIIYGKLYAIGDIQCHYFCALLSCCLVQKGSDEEGLFGFLYPDILAEVERSKKHRCSYCNREGASLGCSVVQCRKQFHLPCGRERDAISLFYGNYKSFCVNHAPKQKIVDSIMLNVKSRIAEQRKNKHGGCRKKYDSNQLRDVDDNKTEVLCVICYEQVDGFPSTRTFWPPCCARDAWFHRTCLQRMSLSAGMHYLKCPLCNDKEEFYKAVVSQGYYVPDRDAAWELEQNAFAEIYERPIYCSADTCKCIKGREYDSDAGLWDIKLCILCGSTAIHAGCTDSIDEQTNIYICHICKPAAPGDLDKLIANIEKVQLQEQSAETIRFGPVMPSRMSIRRTKPKNNYGPGSSRSLIQTQATNSDNVKTRTETSRLELNLKKPARRILEPAGKNMGNMENILLSPIKMLEQGFSEKIGQLENIVVDSPNVLEKLREQLKKPRPLVVKKRIINKILDELFSNILQDRKNKDVLKEWNSPIKTFDIKIDNKDIIEEATPTKTNIDDKIIDISDTVSPKPIKAISLQFTNILPEKYAKETENKEFKCNFKHKHIDNTHDGTKLRTAIDFAIDAHKENKRKIPCDETVPFKKRKFDNLIINESNPDKSDLENNRDDSDKENVTDVDKVDVDDGKKSKDIETDKNSVDDNDELIKDGVQKDTEVIDTLNENLEIDNSKSEFETRVIENEGTKELEIDITEVMVNNDELIHEKGVVDEIIFCEDTTPKKKNILSLKRNSGKKSVEKEKSVIEKTRLTVTETIINAEVKNIPKLEEVGDFNEIQKDIIKKIVFTDKELKSNKDSVKGKKINCSLKRRSGNKSDEIETKLKKEENASDVDERRNTEENIEKLGEVEFKEDITKKNDIDKINKPDEELKCIKDSSPRKKINCSLKRRPGNKSAERLFKLSKDKNKFDLDETRNEELYIKKLREIEERKDTIKVNNIDGGSITDKEFKLIKDTLPKRKFNCSLKRRSENNSDEKAAKIKKKEENKSDLDETKNAENIEKLKEVKLREDITEKYNLDKIKETNKESSPKKKINCSLKRKSRNKSFERATIIVDDENKSDLDELKDNELDIQKLEELELKEDIKKNDMYEKRIADTIKSNTVQKKKITTSLKRRSERKLINKEGSLKIENSNCNNNSDNTKDIIELEDLNKFKNIKDIIQKDKTGKKQDKIRKKIRNKEMWHGSKDGNRRHKRSDEKERKKSKEVIDLTMEEKKLKLKYGNKDKKKLSIQNKDIKVKIKWKKEHFKLKITDKKEKKKKKIEEKSPKSLKQYVLKYSSEVTSPKEMIVKPEIDVTIRRKYVKIEKHSDNMVQTDISSFFKSAPKI